MDRFQRNLLFGGAGGLLICFLLLAVGIWLVQSGIVRPLLPYPSIALLTALTLGLFSLAEIPMMVFTMRRLLIERTENRGVVLGLNLLYVSFAGVYAVPVVLLTGYVGWGVALGALGVIRLVTALIFVGHVGG